MTSVYEIRGWEQVAAFVAWTLAVCALAKALFGSFVAAEVQHWLAVRGQPQRTMLGRLNWEVGNRARWSAEVARQTPGVLPEPLSDVEVDRKRAELVRLSRRSVWGRAGTYFMGCFACQSFWTAAGIYAATVGVADPLGWLLTAAAYSGAAVLVAGLRVRDAGAVTGGCGRKAGASRQAPTQGPR